MDGASKDGDVKDELQDAIVDTTWRPSNTEGEGRGDGRLLKIPA